MDDERVTPIERSYDDADRHVDMMQRELDAIAWELLGSQFTGRAYRGWPIDRRLDAYLLHRGLTAVADDGGVCNALLERIMANVGLALRNGML